VGKERALDFEKELVNAGLSLDANGNIDAIGKSFCFYPRDPEAEEKMGRVVMGRVAAVICTTDNNIVLFMNMPGAVSGKQVALRYFPKECDEIKKGTVSAPGWYIAAIDPSGFALNEYWIGTLKFI
jgi:hypothetical protein